MKRAITIFLPIFLIFGILLILPKNQKYSINISDALGTVSKITIYQKNDTALSDCRNYIYKMDNLLSATSEESEIFKLNKNKEIDLTPEIQDILQTALAYTDQTSFNPFCGTLIQLWENSKQIQTLPQQNDIQNAISSSYPPSLQFENDTISLKNTSQEINLGAIAKGYITDEIVDILDSHNIKSALINLGGNVYAKGLNNDKKPWKIGISHPDRSGEYIGILSVSDMAVITSGDYERYFEIDGIRYHHILDPKTGYPARSDLRSVTIISPNATLGDMLSTKCFILGFEESKKILDQYNVHAVFITENKEIYFSKEIEDIFTHTSNEFTFKKF